MNAAREDDVYGLPELVDYIRKWEEVTGGTRAHGRGEDEEDGDSE